jgi:DNA polymerase-3 subunit beta
MTDSIKSIVQMDVKQLRTVLKDVVGVVEARSTVPILSDVLFTAARDAVTVVGSDLDIWMERRADIADGESLSVAVHAETFSRIAGKLPADGRVKLTAENGKLTVATGRSRFQLPTLPVDTFPIVPSTNWDATFEIDAILLGAAIGRVMHAISTDETRLYLGGVFIHAIEGSLRFATTDGHRLARVQIDAPEGAGEIPDVILPRKAVRVLSGLLDKFEGKVEVSVSRARLQFTIGETTMTSKTIDGTFPDYVRVIPTANELLVQVDRTQLIEAVGRVTIVSSDKTRAVKMAVSRDLITLTVNSLENGQAIEEVSCSYTGIALTIGFNSKYLLESLGQMAADSIDARFSDEKAPSLWRDADDSPALFVLMPMKV